MPAELQADLTTESTAAILPSFHDTKIADYGVIFQSSPGFSDLE